MVTPVSAPWVFLNALRGGYICGYSSDEKETTILINDTYEDEALELYICLGEQNIPTGAEIIWQGRRVIALNIQEFAVL